MSSTRLPGDTRAVTYAYVTGIVSVTPDELERMIREAVEMATQTLQFELNRAVSRNKELEARIETVRKTIR